MPERDSASSEKKNSLRKRAIKRLRKFGSYVIMQPRSCVLKSTSTLKSPFHNLKVLMIKQGENHE